MNLTAERAAFRALEEHRLFAYIGDVMVGETYSYVAAFDDAIDNSGIESETLLETLTSCANYNGRDDYVRFRDETDAHYGSERGHPDGSLSTEEWEHGSDEDIARFEAWLEREDANDPMRGCTLPERCAAHKDFHTDEECADQTEQTARLARTATHSEIAREITGHVMGTNGASLGKYQAVMQALAAYDERNDSASQREGEKP